MTTKPTTPTDELNGALIGFCAICITYGIALGTIALGAGLMLLTVVQGIGFGILGFGMGMLYGFTFGANGIIASIAEVIVERARDRSIQLAIKELDKYVAASRKEKEV